MKKKYLLIVILFLSFNTFSQKTKCEDLIKYAKEESFYNEEISSYELSESSWLKKVKAYHFRNNSTLIIAEIKLKNSYETKKYVFCGVSFDTWVIFKTSVNQHNTTYGERFHKYIFNNKCDCN
ncbi:hypothetical protein [Polaribacter atrinae]|uniref:Uncharacterized protein n=1 Tax=Polaribacter atrinae TaxID=1333662 RepID=A0A176TDX7_9FLAO|nr:hypothetical protein [Polaribacter atrinae]OAD45606.1 hypothetical protein LPB303_06485 [Polaribacter atrinae]